ncbi:MAG: immunoglobulin-like domain-containing protein, partial [Bacteroidia bacterium]
SNGSTPNYTIIYGSLNSPNMTVRFDGSGKYKICLTASNKKGAGNTECKVDYIDVTPSFNMLTPSVAGSNVTATATSGYLYDNGGPFKPYTAPNNGITRSGITIGGCSDSVFLVFTKFDIACGYDVLNVYAGNNNKATSLQQGCTGAAYTGAGYTGGASSTNCANWTLPGCLPKVTDTFKTKGNMFIEMTYYYGQNSKPGFEAYYWTKKGTDKPPVAKFSSVDSVCVNGLINFKNETVGNNVTYRWDLDGDTSTWEPAGKSPNYAYFTEGEVTITMIATNCSGSDTFQKKIQVFEPVAPVVDFTADNTNPTLNDVVFLSTDMTMCVDDYKWTITSASGNGTAVYVNGTGSASPNPQVSFTDTGCYSVELFVKNSQGDDNLKLNCFIKVKGAYCTPSVQNQISDVGISNVTISTINNTSSQGVTGYNNYLTNLSQATTLEIGATYKLTVSRNTVNNKATRTVWIDWNGDGDFTDGNEKIAEELNASTLSWSTDVTVPAIAKVGATVMRVAINQGSNSNTPCGPNKFGEFEDYRLYIRQDFTLPVITLKGLDTVRIEQGESYTDSGATAFDNLDGDLTANIQVVEPSPSGFNMIPDTYTYTYNVKDAAGNEAITVRRIVIVVPDSTAPELIVTKPDTIDLQVFIPFVAPAVIAASDLVDGDLTGAVQTTNNVDNKVIGTYTVTYTVKDQTGNVTTVIRTVRVIDTIAPTITLVGSATVNHNVNTPYVDSNVVVTDNYTSESELRSNLTVTNNVDTNTVGIYSVVYTLKDPNTGRSITVTRTVNVVDTENPMLTLIGDTAIILDVNSTLVDPGVTISDNYDKNLSYATGGSFYDNFPTGKATIIGKYVIVYSAIDASGNASSLSRTVNVVDRIAPEITLVGNAAVSVCRWATYTDSGMTVTDNYYQTNDITITTEGTYLTEGTKMEGVYTLRYKAVDKSGNVSYSLWRYIFVRDPHEAPCATVTSVGKQIGLDKLVKVYPNPNTGKFTVEANLPATEQVRISITNLLGQEVAVISNGAMNTNTFSIDLSDQKAGVYMLTVTTNKQSTTKRIVITK